MGKRKREKEGDKDHGEAEETDVPPKKMKIDESKVEDGGKVNMACILGYQQLGENIRFHNSYQEMSS